MKIQRNKIIYSTLVLRSFFLTLKNFELINFFLEILEQRLTSINITFTTKQTTVQKLEKILLTDF